MSSFAGRNIYRAPSGENKMQLFWEIDAIKKGAGQCVYRAASFVNIYDFQGDQKLYQIQRELKSKVCDPEKIKCCEIKKS